MVVIIAQHPKEQVKVIRHLSEFYNSRAREKGTE